MGGQYRKVKATRWQGTLLVFFGLSAFISLNPPEYSDRRNSSLKKIWTVSDSRWLFGEIFIYGIYQCFLLLGVGKVSRREKSLPIEIRLPGSFK
jgi:hypothetical protein